MSATIVVPAAVPSLDHNSWPAAVVVALNHTRVPTVENDPKVVSAEPVVMSDTKFVPAEVPSLTHSSIPVDPSFAVK
jgi:hypothetical protein